MTQEVALHLKCADLIASTLDDINTGATPDPVNAVFVDRCVSQNTKESNLSDEGKNLALDDDQSQDDGSFGKLFIIGMCAILNRNPANLIVTHSPL